MLGHDGSTVEQSDSAVVGDQSQGLFDMIWRYRIDVGVEASESGLVDAHRRNQVGGEHRTRQRKQSLLFLDQTVGDRALGKIGVMLLVGDGVDESQQVAIALLDSVNVTASEKAVAQKTDLALHSTFLIASVRSAQSQLDVHGAAEVEEQGMEASHVAVSLKHDNFGIIEEPLAGSAAEERSRAHQ